MTLQIKTPTNLVLYGITGDLAHKKIIPALYHLYQKNLLPELFNVIGFSRRDLSKEDVDKLVRTIIKIHRDIMPSEEDLKGFLKYFTYVQGNFTNLEDYKKLGEKLGLIDNEWASCSSKLYYLSVPPAFYKDIFNNIAKSGLAKECSDETGWTRVIVEKPFGQDLGTAKELDMLLAELFREEQIFRIDHFVAKEMLQNIIAFRFANKFIENSWDNNSIESIEIYFPEDFGVENRTNFYEGVGALRDVGQNHLLQILALTTMEEPKNFSDKEIRTKRAEILKKLHIPNVEEIKQITFRGQYESYKYAENIPENSKTETYFKIKTFLEYPKWENVPIILESGKNMHEKDLKIYVNFKVKNGVKNLVTFDLDGADMGIYIDFWAKKPGLKMELEKRKLSFSLLEDCEECSFAEPYEKLILDCMNGDQTLFISSAEIKALWRFIDPIICAWDSNEVPLVKYKDFDPAIRAMPRF